MDVEQLYDLTLDPSQQQNVIDDEDYKAVVNTFQIKMRAYIDSICPMQGGGECNKPALRYPSETAAPYATDNSTTSTTTTWAPWTTSEPWSIDGKTCLRSPPAVSHGHDIYRLDDEPWTKVAGADNVYSFELNFDAYSLRWDDANIAIRTRLFNGFFPSQTLRMERGNEYRITVNNRLGPESVCVANLAPFPRTPCAQCSVNSR